MTGPVFFFLLLMRDSQRMQWRLAMGGLVLASLAACTATQRVPASDAELHRAVTYLSGSFSSAAQASMDPDFFDIRLEMTPIWSALKRRGGRYIYVEQAAAGALERPYRQRIYHVSIERTGTVRRAVYELPGDSLAFAGWWRTPERFDDAFGPEDLIERTGCDITMTWDADEQGYVGSTLGQGCESSLRGAAYATSEVLIRLDYLETWDRGFDAAGDQVWGAVKGPYRFDRVR